MPSVGANGWSCLRQVYSASPRPNRSNWPCWASIHPRRLYSSTKRPISSLATWVVQNAANSGVGRSLIAIAKARGIKTINLVRRPELIPELQAIGGDLVVVDEDGALDNIRAAVGNRRVPLATDGVAGKSSAMNR